MQFRFFMDDRRWRSGHGDIPAVLSAYALPYTSAEYIEFDQGSYLLQEIRGICCSFWLHYLSIQSDIELEAGFDEECRSLSCLQKGTVSVALSGGGHLQLEEGSCQLLVPAFRRIEHFHFVPGLYCFLQLDMWEALWQHLDFMTISPETLDHYLNSLDNSIIRLPGGMVHAAVQNCFRNLATCTIMDPMALEDYTTFQALRLLFELNLQLPAIKKVRALDSIIPGD